MKVLVPKVPTRIDRLSGQRVPAIDLNPASEYGKLFALTPPDKDLPFEDELEQLRTNIAQMDPKDFILCVGDVALVAAAICYANDMFGTVKLLRWEKRDQAYTVQEIQL